MSCAGKSLTTQTSHGHTCESSPITLASCTSKGAGHTLSGGSSIWPRQPCSQLKKLWNLLGMACVSRVIDLIVLITQVLSDK